MDSSESPSELCGKTDTKIIVIVIVVLFVCFVVVFLPISNHLQKGFSSLCLFFLR